MRTLLKSLAGSSVVHVLVAFFAMGSWAVFANRNYPMPKPLVAGVVQGMLSACLTLCLKKAVEALASCLPERARLWAPPLIACLASTALLSTIHLLSGTPEILRTIAVPLMVSSSYAAIYNYSIVRGGRGRHGNG
ncbi:hypothetical protein [Rhizobium sp. BK376]|uniref:hypothetical protein n=1 Tax=Rhizobium sp. BK376 TaxID=2512149 RepID=UPI0010447FA9|nr:hypothetical protein [Rhizobium sp. BK376]TCR79631.1 hypothetical protein EV561_115129 [Rhizobium sp. BK376]